MLPWGKLFVNFWGKRLPQNLHLFVRWEECTYVYVRERDYKHILMEACLLTHPFRGGTQNGGPGPCLGDPWARRPFPLPCQSLLSQPARQQLVGLPGPITHPSPPHRPTRPGRAKTFPWAVPRKWRRRARCPCRPIAALRWACRPSPAAGCPTWWGPGPAGRNGTREVSQEAFNTPLFMASGPAAAFFPLPRYQQQQRLPPRLGRHLVIRLLSRPCLSLPLRAGEGGGRRPARAPLAGATAAEMEQSVWSQRKREAGRSGKSLRLRAVSPPPQRAGREGCVIWPGRSGSAPSLVRVRPVCSQNLRAR